MDLLAGRRWVRFVHRQVGDWNSRREGSGPGSGPQPAAVSGLSATSRKRWRAAGDPAAAPAGHGRGLPAGGRDRVAPRRTVIGHRPAIGGPRRANPRGAWPRLQAGARTQRASGAARPGTRNGFHGDGVPARDVPPDRPGFRGVGARRPIRSTVGGQSGSPPWSAGARQRFPTRRYGRRPDWPGLAVRDVPSRVKRGEHEALRLPCPAVVSVAGGLQPGVGQAADRSQRDRSRPDARRFGGPGTARALEPRVVLAGRAALPGRRAQRHARSMRGGPIWRRRHPPRHRRPSVRPRPMRPHRPTPAWRTRRSSS